MKVTVSIFGKIFEFKNVPDWDEEILAHKINASIKKNTTILKIEDEQNPFEQPDMSGLFDKKDFGLDDIKNIFGIK